MRCWYRFELWQHTLVTLSVVTLGWTDNVTAYERRTSHTIWSRLFPVSHRVLNIAHIETFVRLVRDRWRDEIRFLRLISCHIFSHRSPLIPPPPPPLSLSLSEEPFPNIRMTNEKYLFFRARARACVCVCVCVCSRARI